MRPTPPKYPLRFLRWFCREDYIDEIEGDLLELFEKRAKKSEKNARWRFGWDVLCSFRVKNIKEYKMKHTMLHHLSLRQSLRYIVREKGYTLLNVASLTIGVILFMLFAWYAAEETSFDKFHSNSHNVYRVVFREYMDQGPYATTSYPVGPAIRSNFPEVQYMSRFGSSGRLTVRQGEIAFFENVNTADADFFRLFDFRLLKGNPATVLEAPNAVAISERIAQKYFAGQDPIGKTLNIGTSGAYNAQVTAVFEDIPANSQLQFDIVLSYSTLEKLYSELSGLWTQMPENYTYVALYPETDVAAFEKKLSLIRDTYVADLQRGDYKLELNPLTEVHFAEGFNRELRSRGHRASLVTFGLIAFAVLLVSVFNFVNLTSSRYLMRLKEMGIRKVIGASRAGLVAQLLFQSFLVVLFSLALALLLLVMLLPVFNGLTGKQFGPGLLLQSETFLTALLLLVFGTLGAGILPALGITAVKPAQSLKAKNAVQTGSWKGGKSLILVFQYAVSVILLVASIVIFRQLQYMQSAIGGGAEEGTLVVPINSNLAEKYELLSERLLTHPAVHEVGASTHVPGFYGDSWPLRLTPTGEPLQTENFVITPNYPALMDYELVAGRFLDKNLASDLQAGFVVNETCARMLGFSEPEAALGQTAYFGGDELKEGKIIGVTRDFHFESFKEKIGPAMFQFAPFEWMRYNFIVVKTPVRQALEAIDALQLEVAEIDQKWVVEAEFFDEHYRKFHLDEIRQGKLSVIFASVAIMLSCLGQLGLLLNGMLSRKKEIAVRKVLGATIDQLWYLMTRAYIRLFLLALLAAIPLAWYLTHQWLATFAYHISAGIWPFAAAAAISGLLLMTIVSLVTVRSAMANPVNSLKDE